RLFFQNSSQPSINRIIHPNDMHSSFLGLTNSESSATSLTSIVSITSLTKTLTGIPFIIHGNSLSNIGKVKSLTTDLIVSKHYVPLWLTAIFTTTSPVKVNLNLTTNMLRSSARQNNCTHSRLLCASSTNLQHLWKL